MTSWSLRWRILAEVVLLVVVTTVAATMFSVPGAVVVGLLAVSAGALRARSLSHQLNRMTEGVLRTASVDRSFRISPEGPAEISRMARAVNRLADRLFAAMDSADLERERFELILETMAEGVLLVDEDGIVEFANPKAIALLGPEVEYSPGDRLINLNNNYDLNDLAAVPSRSGRSANKRLDIRDSARTVQANASPLDDRDGRRKTVLILTDITAIRRTETTRREFVSNASHELRTPVAAIRASAETLQGAAGEDPEARSSFLERIVADSVRLERMVKEMLDLSRLESGQTNLDTKEVEPRQFLCSVQERMQLIARQSGVELSVEAPDTLPAMNADSERLGQVFTNLIANAINAMPDGGRIDMTATVQNGHVLFRVKDNGNGIPSAHLPHVFERFYKVDSSRSNGGTGLGLAISRHIVQLHDGEISVDSSVGVGTTFSIRIPVLR